VAALLVKHVLAFGFVAGGVWLWLKRRRQVRAVEEQLAAGTA